MKRPEFSPADNLRRKKAAKKVDTILNNYHKRRLGIEGVKRKILEIDGVDWVNLDLFYSSWGGTQQLAEDHGYFSPKGGEQDYYYKGGIGMNSDNNQLFWLYFEERNSAIRREKREAEAMYCVTCGSDTTDGTEIEFWYTDGEE